MEGSSSRLQLKQQVQTVLGPLLLTWFIKWINNYIHFKVYRETIYPLPIFNSWTVQVFTNGYVMSSNTLLCLRILIHAASSLQWPSASFESVMETYWYIIQLCFAISAHRIKNCEIRVGLDESDIGNNAVCVLWLEEMGPMVSKRFSCIPNLYGNWISVNKTTPVGPEILQLQEVQVFGSGYYPTMGLTYPPPPPH